MELFNGKYVIDNDGFNTTVKEKTEGVKVIKDKEGNVLREEVVYNLVGYYSTTEQGFTGLLNYLLKQKTKSDKKINGVKEIIEIIEETKLEIIEELKRVQI